jgi:predicted Rossmann-fold nucleotide-binding protein
MLFPGGFGTMDELFEILTLQQTRKAPSIPIVLVDEAYWRGAINFNWLVEQGTLSPDDLQPFSVAADAEGAWRQLEARGIGRD